MKKHTGTLRRRKPSLFVALSGVFLLLNVADAAPPESVFTKSLGFSKKGDNSHPRSPRRKGKLFGGLHEPASKATESARGTSSEDETAPTGLVGFGFGDASSPANAGEARHALYAAALGFSLSVGLLDRDETAIVTPGILDGVEWAAKALRRAVKGGATPEKDMKQLVDKTETVLRDISRVEVRYLNHFCRWGPSDVAQTKNCPSAAGRQVVYQSTRVEAHRSVMLMFRTAA